MDEAENLFISTFLISLTFARGLNSDEQNLLGNYLQVIVVNLCAISNFNTFFNLSDKTSNISNKENT